MSKEARRRNGSVPAFFAVEMDAFQLGMVTEDGTITDRRIEIDYTGLTVEEIVNVKAKLDRLRKKTKYKHDPLYAAAIKAYHRAWDHNNRSDPQRRSAVNSRLRASKSKRMLEPEYAAKMKQINQDWHRKNAASIREYKRKYEVENRERFRIGKLENQRLQRLRVLGLTPEDYNNLLAEQDYKCAVCLSPHENGNGGRLHLDHCHESGRVRGFLCGPCNRALGMLKDDPMRILMLAEYAFNFCVEDDNGEATEEA